MTSLSLAPPVVSPSGKCIHCRNDVPRFRGDEFCCNGCETVYALLKERGWENYYSLRNRGGELRRRGPAPESVSETAFAYLNDPEFLRDYRSEIDGATAANELQFYLEGVHCAACVWLVEKVASVAPGVESVRLDLGSSVATVRIAEGSGFSGVASEFQRMGYTPHAIRLGEAEVHRAREDRVFLIRLGIAGAATGNLMLMAVSLYAGAGEPWFSIFRWLSLGIFLPVLFYSAVPFYRSALSAWRMRQVSIDVPIVLGILLGTISSFINLISGSDHIYFDSLGALVFLLLASRYVLRKSQARALNHRRLSQFMRPSRVFFRTQSSDAYEEGNLDQLKPGYWVRVVAGETIPIDGVVRVGRSAVDASLLTGETAGLPVTLGTQVYAGTVNQDGPIEIEVTASGGSTRLGRILKESAESLKRKAPIVLIADRVAKAFVGVVTLAVVVGVMVGLQTDDWQEGLNRALALALVTCPCALALATPLSFLLTIGRLGERGILIKGDDTLERLSQIQTVFFDKTGTLTTGRFEVNAFELAAGVPNQARTELAAVALALEMRSRHPVALAIQRYFEKSIDAKQVPEVEDFREQIGKGVSGRVSGRFYTLVRSLGSATGSSTQLELREGDQLRATFSLGDQIREDAQQAVKSLRRLGMDIRIVSGDGAGAVEHVADELGVDRAYAYSTISPEGKAAIVRDFPRAVMVGDGANDAIALSAASVGIAAHGGVELSLRAADVYLSRPSVTSTVDTLVAARETMRIVRRNFGISLIYNLVGAVAAVAGWINPLVAALLMPLSAFTVFLSAQWGTRRLRRIWSGS